MVRQTCGIYEALWIARLHQASAGALYLHIPFCAKKCAYCDFASWATSPDDLLMRDYVAALIRLLDEAAHAGLVERVETAYVGGGTPTLVGASLAELLGALTTMAPRLVEVSCEANPDSLGDDLLAALAEAGCTRLSVGVQSLADNELAALGRIHTADQALDRLRAAVETGLDVSCDLMCAIPHQSGQSWQQSLQGVLACGVGHVSVYPLQIEEGTPLDERYAAAETPWNDTSVQAQRMEAACEVLQGAGLSRYEVASYALPGSECRHNQAYWTAVPYLGIGCSASSMLTREGYARLKTVTPQLPELPGDVRRVRLTCADGRRELAASRGFRDLHFDLELLDERQAAAEDLMLAMRMSAGADPGLQEHARHVLGATVLDDAWDKAATLGLARLANGRWVPTEQGWLLGNELYGLLWDLAPGVVTTLAV